MHLNVYIYVFIRNEPHIHSKMNINANLYFSLYSEYGTIMLVIVEACTVQSSCSGSRASAISHALWVCICSMVRP